MLRAVRGLDQERKEGNNQMKEISHMRRIKEIGTPKTNIMFLMFRLDVSIAHARVSKQGHITDLPKYNRTEFQKNQIAALFLSLSYNISSIIRGILVKSP